MATVLDRYGIKEVADVTFYKIDSKGNIGDPVLYLDTLKVSTIEQTAEQAEARGGKGNPPLIMWDYGKEINVTLEDALFSAKSMSIMFGDGTIDSDNVIYKTLSKNNMTYDSSSSSFSFEMNNNTYKIAASKCSLFKYDDSGSATVGTTGDFDLAKFKLGDVNGLTVTGNAIEISANSFPGTYYVTGDTYARREADGVDEFFQFVIPKAKVLSENTLTLEAEGDPSVFNMNLRVLRPADGKMMKLIKYSI